MEAENKGALQCELRECDGSVLVCPCMRERTASIDSRASTSYSCLSLPLALSIFLSFPLHLSHLFICRCLTVLITGLGLAQHVLPKQDTEMEFEKESVGDCKTGRERDSEREKERGRE